jgi:hypothetical protein
MSKEHGMVRAKTMRFEYEDGTKYIPFGTTCYAWTHQSRELQEKTLETLSNSPFNKVRMCVFPKSMAYNNNDPDHYPFFKNCGKWDVTKPDPAFWENFERRVSQLEELGIEADIILFHPYDRWGFASLPREDNLKYLEYCLKRLGPHKNVWWSLANEWDFVTGKTVEDWDVFGEYVSKNDSYGHLLSIHNGFTLYEKRHWMTHYSIQNSDTGRVIQWRNKYHLPIIVDECRYEGNIEFDWGNITGFELVNKFWTAITRGGFCTHGETFWREDEVLWWAKGGELYGDSPKRIAFLKDLLYHLPGHVAPRDINPFSDPNKKDEAASDNHIAKVLMNLSENDRSNLLSALLPAIAGNENCRLWYLGRSCPLFQDVMLPEKGKYKIEIVDVWEMSRMVFTDNANGKTRVRLSAKEGIAVLITRIEGDVLW